MSTVHFKYHCYIAYILQSSWFTLYEHYHLNCFLFLSVFDSAKSAIYGKTGDQQARRGAFLTFLTVFRLYVFKSSATVSIQKFLKGL